jgi:peptidoglycan/LPS O-acetylase OafA/YrhL
VYDVLGIAAAGCIAALLVVDRPTISFVPTAVVYPALVVAAYVGAFRGPVLNRIVRFVPLVTIGGMCYTIYLYHMLLLSAAGAVSSRVIAPALGLNVNWLAQLGLVAPVVVSISAVLFVAFEKPFMRPDWVDAVVGRASTRRVPRDEAIGALQPDEAQ